MSLFAVNVSGLSGDIKMYVNSLGSEDKTVRVWGLTLGLVVATFRHQAPVTAVTAMLDGRRVVSSDRAGSIRVWAADSGTLIQSVCGPGRCFAVASDMR